MTVGSPQNFGLTPGQQVVTQNTGVKRIVGTDLVALGKVPGWLYYLIDIQSYVVYANDGNEVWFNSFGQPAAGSLAYRDSINPFEGYRFYVVEEDIAYEWKGGSWEGEVFEGNTLQPTYLVIPQTGTLTLGRKHFIVGNGSVVLPIGNVKTGHEIEFEVETVTTVEVDGEFYPSTTTITAQDSSEVVYGSVVDVEHTLVRGVPHKAVYYNDQWHVFIADTDSAVDAINNGRGILKTGSSVEGTLTFSVDFVEEGEELDLEEDSRAVTPAVIRELVTLATLSSEFNNITGLLPKASDPTFAFTISGDRTVVSYPTFQVGWNEEPYTRTVPLELEQIPAGSVSLPDVTGSFTWRLVLRKGDGVVLQGTAPDSASTDEIYMGYVVVVDGAVAVGAGGTDLAIPRPWLASSDFSLRALPVSIEGALYSASTSLQGKLVRSETSFIGESTNFVNSTVSPHKLTFGAAEPANWSYLDRAGNLIGEQDTDLVDGSSLDTGSAVNNNRYSIQIVYLGSTGLVGVLMGQIEYNTLTEALAQVENYNPVVPTLLDGTVEVSRWVVKGDQYVGSATYDLTDADNFAVTTTNAGTGGGTGGSSAGDIISSTQNNTLNSSNLQLQVDELSARTSSTFVTGGGALSVGDSPFIADDSTYTLPAVVGLKVGTVVRVAARGGVTPTIAVEGAAGEHMILSTDLVDRGDIDFYILSTDNGIYFTFTWNGTNWEV